jgi:hypothetical protein
MIVSLGVEAVWRAQRYSRELADSVWSVKFYRHLLDVLENETWREYTTEAFGRPCRFDDLREFLISPDGLGWPPVDEVLEMIEIVSLCSPPPPPRQNEPAHSPITHWAKNALEKLDKGGVRKKPSPQRNAERMLALESPQFAPEGRPCADPEENPDIIRVNAETGGTSAAYLAARLKKAKRDDLLEEIGPGKRFRSVRAAAIEAGIIKPVPTVRLVDDPLKVAAAIRKHLTPEQLAQLVEALTASPS